MKKTLSILFLGTALTLAACGKDKKPATSEPAAAAPAAEPAKTDPNAAAAPAAPAAPAGGDQAKPEEAKKGGW
jgi:ABC-type oligopeptide transport system substrate-binding subunit